MIFRWINNVIKLDMCLWNTDVLGSYEVKTFKSHILTHPLPPGACDVSELWATLGWTYSPSLVTVSLPILYILHLISKQDRIIDKQMNDLITRCPQPAFQALGIKS